MPPVEPNDEERQQELPQDNGQTPFQPADPAPSDATDDANQAGQIPPFDPTHPAADTDVDKQELYDAGGAAATNAEEPRDDAVVGYQEPEEPDGLS